MPALLHRVAAWLLLTLLVLGVAGGGHPAVQAEDSAAATAGRGKTRPVLLLPGFASSQLQSWSHRRCEKGFRKNLYRDVNIGDRLWIDIGRVLAQSDCWISCMQLHTANQSEVDCKLRAGEGLDAISELDPGLVTGPLSTVWRDIIKDLVQHFHLGPDQLIVAPYDWRLPPSKLQERDRYFYQLMKKIEYTVDLNGGDALVVIAHSMGNNMLRYFLAWLKLEIGVNHWQEWIDKHISAYFAVGAPLLGSAEALELITSGVTNGLPVSLSAIRQMVVSFGSILGFMPIPAATDSALDDDTLISVRFHEGLDYHGESIDRTVNYSSKEIASGQFFRDLAPHDPIFQDLETVRQKFYVEDEVVDQLSPWDRPPIKSVYAIYGVNVPTRYNYQYQHKTDADDWYMMEVAHEEGPDMLCGKTGDGTVPYHSLSWSHSWFGQQTTSVSVTQTPQSVYFSAGDIRRVRAVRNDTAHHAQYEQAGSGKSLCDADDSEGGSWTGGAGSAGNEGFFNGLFGSSADNQITFYESTEETAAGIRSTSVWEIDGARHREILSNSAFLRELRMELRNIFNDGVTADKTSRPPMIDTDCYWNYRRAQCEFPDFCEYRYNFGDVVLDQSCRIRPTNKLLTAPPHVATIAPVLDMATLTKAADSVAVPITTSRPSYMPASSSCGMYNECTTLA